jgi:hypothetical protein
VDWQNFTTSPSANVVPICRRPGYDTKTSVCSEENVFDVAWTSFGICATFNSIPTDKMYQQNEWLDKFETLYRPGLKGQNKTVVMIDGTGDDYRLDALMTNYGNNLKYPFQKQVPKSEIVLNIQDYFNAFETNWNQIQLVANSYIHIGITITVVDARYDVKDVAIHKRKCKFLDEFDDSKLFRYSKTNCSSVLLL